MSPSTSSSASPRPVVGLIPAAGTASRLGDLPCSKEIFPVGWEQPKPDSDPRPKVASHYLFDQMRRAGIETAYVILREGKWDIPAYWGDGQRAGLNVAYLMMRSPYGTPFTLNQAYPFVRDHRVAMGFPDILLAPDDVYVRLLQHQEDTGADVVLGLFPARRPEKVDMVELDADGRPQRFVVKPKETSLTYTWICAVWAPAFTLYLNTVITEAEPRWRPTDELFVGHVFQKALHDGLEIDAVCFPEGTYTDIGTPDALLDVIRGEAGARASVS
jgi:glucose-1-phosphate thymidylyltransferase